MYTSPRVSCSANPHNKALTKHVSQAIIDSCTNMAYF